MNDESTETKAAKSSASASPPVWFWVISVIAMLWFLMDMSAFFMRVFMTEQMLSGMAESERHLYQDMPFWVNIVFAGEVFGGALGCVGLLLRKKWSLPLFIVSIVGVLSQTFHVYFLSDAISTMGTPAIVMPLLAIAIGVGMIVVARSAISSGWMR